MGPNLFFDAFLVLFVAFSIGFDLKENRIPNWLVYPAMAGGLLLNMWKGLPYFFESFLGLSLGIGILIIPFALGTLGAGDVKLLGAAGAILGVKLIPRVFFYTAIFGAVLALISIAFKGITFEVFNGFWREVKLLIATRGVTLPETVSERSLKGARTVPYGVAIGLGVLLAFYVDPKGEWAGF